MLCRPLRCCFVVVGFLEWILLMHEWYPWLNLANDSKVSMWNEHESVAVSYWNIPTPNWACSVEVLFTFGLTAIHAKAPSTKKRLSKWEWKWDRAFCNVAISKILNFLEGSTFKQWALQYQQVPNTACDTATRRHAPVRFGKTSGFLFLLLCVFDGLASPYFTNWICVHEPDSTTMSYSIESWCIILQIGY